METEMQSRDEAARAGRVTYHGKPCNHGHGTERYVLSNACVHCDRSNAKRQYERRKARVKELKAMRQGV